MESKRCKRVWLTGSLGTIPYTWKARSSKHQPTKRLKAMKPPAVRRFLRTCKLCLEDVGFGSSGFFSREDDNHSHGSMVPVVFEGLFLKTTYSQSFFFVGGEGVGEQFSEKMESQPPMGI